jgi:hypothetical protein
MPFFAQLASLNARIELVAQFLRIDTRADGDDLCARLPISPLIQFGYLRATSDNLKGDPLVR